MSESAPASSTGPRRFAVLLAYEGTRYAGSQLQPKDPTVQSVMEAAIQQVTQEAYRVAFAGRTDAGVHALGQVAAFDSQTGLKPEILLRALNATLPDDVAVRSIAEVAADFDPRRHAVRRHYRYTIENSPVRPVLGRETAWHVSAALNVDAMARAARGLVGSHDFAAFASRLESPDASTVRTLFRFEVRREGAQVVLDVEANAFLPHQVRRMTGALVEAGKGKLSETAFAALLGGAPSTAGPAAPARGLCLMRVDYADQVFAL